MLNTQAYSLCRVGVSMCSPLTLLPPPRMYQRSPTSTPPWPALGEGEGPTTSGLLHAPVVRSSTHKSLKQLATEPPSAEVAVRGHQQQATSATAGGNNNMIGVSTIAVD